MPSLRLRPAAAVFALALAVPFGTASAARPGDDAAALEQRLGRVERILSSQGLIEMQQRQDSLLREVRELRGQIEELNHALEEMKRRQRDLYLDIDRRLVQMERGGGAPAGNEAPPASSGPQSDNGAGTSPSATAPPSTGAPASSATGNAAVDPAAEQQAYEKAFDLLRDLRYDQAIEAFRKFLADYPHGRYAHIAQYWVGEANYAQRHFKAAIQDYQRLLADYPNSPKRAEAMLKIGYSWYELGEFDRAREVLQRLTRDHPRTTEAGQADNLLEKIRVSGKAKG